MAYNEQLAERIERIILEAEIPYETKKMFGGYCFMINEKLCIAAKIDEIMLRVMDSEFDQLSAMNYARPVDMSGSKMKGFIYVESAAYEKEIDLKWWVDKGIEFGLKGVLKTKKKK